MLSSQRKNTSIPTDTNIVNAIDRFASNVITTLHVVNSMEQQTTATDIIIDKRVPW